MHFLFFVAKNLLQLDLSMVIMRHDGETSTELCVCVSHTKFQQDIFPRAGLMSQKVEINSKAVWILDTLVCVASTGIGMFWGMVYRGTGQLVAGTGGLLVAIVWCYLMRRILYREWNFILVFLAAVNLGGIVGMIDGALLHILCWHDVKGDFMPSTLSRAIYMGLFFGLFSGLANGAFWGIFYSICAFRNAARRKVNGGVHVG